MIADLQNLSSKSVENVEVFKPQREVQRALQRFQILQNQAQRSR